MKVRDIMSRSVISTSPDPSVLDVAALLVDYRISAIPLISGDRLEGIVSEADLMRRYELGTQRHPLTGPWWRRLFAEAHAPSSYVEAHAMKVRDIMTTPVVTVTEDMAVSDVVALFEAHRIRRAPVLRMGSVVGIVSRADFVRALVAWAKIRPRPHTSARSDESIRRALLAELEPQSWWRPSQCHVTVTAGIVRFTGVLNASEEKTAARVAAENISGVHGVEDNRMVSIPVASYM